MTVRKLSSWLLVLASLLLTGELRADEGQTNWLRGSGKDLQLRLRGEVLDADGQPVTDFVLSGGVNSLGEKSAAAAFEPVIGGNKFSFWIPVNQSKLWSGWFKVSSDDGEQLAYKTISAHELRQAAIEGVKIMLERPSREVHVKVVEGDQPISGAEVKADCGYGIELRSRTNASGVATFSLLSGQELRYLTAWTEDYRMGGFSFGRKPTRDPEADEQTIELFKCRDQKLRFVDESGAPVPNVKSVIQMATPPPNFNYVGTNENSSLISDAHGEVIYHWFPDWEEHHFYVDLKSDQWFVEGKHTLVDGVAVFNLKRKRERKWVPGRVVSTVANTGGFYVRLRSFQGERKRHSDSTSVFTNADGSFEIDVLANSTYCAFALDSHWVGKIIDLIPWQSDPELISPTELEIIEGQKVEVLVTSGPEKKPVSDLSISFRRVYDYKWRQDGETRHGSSGPSWWGRTDAAGRAVTQMLPGELKVFVHTPQWRAEQTVKVVAGEPTTIQLHREVDEKRKLTGWLVADEESDFDLQDAKVRVGAIDGSTNYEQTVTTNRYGAFTFETTATKVGIYGSTKAGRAAGLLIVEDLDAPIEVPLAPTVNYQGQLVGEDDQPLPGHGISTTVIARGKFDMEKTFSNSFYAKRFKAKTDAAGNFELRDLPSGVELWIYADSIDDPHESARIEKVKLDPNQLRPRQVHRLAAKKKAAVQIPLAEQFEKRLRDCEAMGYHLLVITTRERGSTARFIDQNFVDHARNPDSYRFMRLAVYQGKELDAADTNFLAASNWAIPGENRIFACALDAQGRELGRLEVDVAAEGAAERAAEFVSKHAPQRSDAEQSWQAAFEKARNSGRKVWMRTSGRFCGPCFRLARWMDDQQELLAKDYVMLKVDDYHDVNGAAVSARLELGRQMGIPFHGIFDHEETLLVDSEGPQGNIGHPAREGGRMWLRTMLMETRQRLTEEEVDRLIDSLQQ